ncbi:MAG: tRNA threonylcarbamoyladenosine dehydratase [Clostridiales bacterium]|nr:tRNA threonylcarbamoyladenosine dehydratase [Clostridiales bacterium]
MERFIREEMLLGPEAMAKLAGAHVAVFGIGGVGSHSAEALVRGGVGKLTFIDNDTVGKSNINRQLIALTSTLGRPKAEVMAERARDINPYAEVRAICGLYSAETREEFFAERYDYIIDAIDLVSCKLDLIETAMARGIPIISSLGTGNKLDPSLFEITDISKTKNCPLARVMRKELRARGIEHHKVLYSPEEPLKPIEMETPPPGRRSIPGSVSWVPSCAGLMLAGEVILGLAKN